MHKSFVVWWQLVMDDIFYFGNIKSTRSQVCTDQQAMAAVAKLDKLPLPLLLLHAAMEGTMSDALLTK